MLINAKELNAQTEYGILVSCVSQLPLFLQNSAEKVLLDARFPQMPARGGTALSNCKCAIRPTPRIRSGSSSSTSLCGDMKKLAR
jgi:hypothetical protein